MKGSFYVQFVFILILIFLCSGCALLISGPKEKVIIHSTPKDVSFVVDGNERRVKNGYIELEKKIEVQFITVEKEGYYSSTYAFNREINPIWPWADIIWLYGAPIAWLVDWYTGAWYQIKPSNLCVALQQKGGEN